MADCACASDYSQNKLTTEVDGVTPLGTEQSTASGSATTTPNHSPKDGSPPNQHSGYTIVELRGTPRNSDELLIKKLKAENSASDDNSEASGAGENNSTNAAKLVLLPRNTVVKRVLSIHEKLEICERAKTGEKKTKLAREYGVQPPAITKVVQNEKKWQAFMANNGEAGTAAENGAKKRGRKRPRLMNVNANANASATNVDTDANTNGNETEQAVDGTTLGLVGGVNAMAAIVGGLGGIMNMGSIGGKASMFEKGNTKYDKSEYGTGIGLGTKRLSSSSTLRMERSLSVASENGFSAHVCTPEHTESPSTGELSSSFAAAIGGARTCLEVLTRLNANLVAQAGHGSPNGSGTSTSTSTARTNGGSAPQPQPQPQPQWHNGSASETGAAAAATAAAAAAPVNIVPVHWFHALFQIEHFFSLLVQQQSQMESQ